MCGTPLKRAADEAATRDACRMPGPHHRLSLTHLILFAFDQKALMFGYQTAIPFHLSLFVLQRPFLTLAFLPPSLSRSLARSLSLAIAFRLSLFACLVPCVNLSQTRADGSQLQQLEPPCEPHASTATCDCLVRVCACVCVRACVVGCRVCVCMCVCARTLVKP